MRGVPPEMTDVRFRFCIRKSKRIIVDLSSLALPLDCNRTRWLGRAERGDVARFVRLCARLTVLNGSTNCRDKSVAKQLNVADMNDLDSSSGSAATLNHPKGGRGVLGQEVDCLTQIGSDRVVGIGLVSQGCIWSNDAVEQHHELRDKVIGQQLVGVKSVPDGTIDEPPRICRLARLRMPNCELDDGSQGSTECNRSNRRQRFSISFDRRMVPNGRSTRRCDHTHVAHAWHCSSVSDFDGHTIARHSSVRRRIVMRTFTSSGRSLLIRKVANLKATLLQRNAC